MYLNNSSSNLVLKKNMEIDTYYSGASNKTVIDLTSATKFLAFVVKDDNCSFQVKNQVDGACCFQAREDGFLIILNHLYEEALNSLYLFENEYIDELLINDFLKKSKLDSIFEVDKYSGSFEAWIRLKVKDDCEEDCLVPYRGREGILTYCNSD